MRDDIVSLIVSNDRARKLMTLEEYAERIGVSVSYLSKIEKGEHLNLPDLEPVNKILKYSGCRIELKLIEENKEW